MAKRKTETGAVEAGVPFPPDSRGQTVLVSIGLFVVVMAVFLPALRNGFVNFDDDVYVYENPRVLRGLTWENIRWAFTTLEAGFWHPLTWCSLFLDQQVFGLKSFGFHLTNLVFHALNTVLLFLLFRRMTGAVWRSAFVAALFALHPLHVEPVVWVASRKDVLSTFFWMLSLLAYVWYVKERERAHGKSSLIFFYALAFVFFVCGLMSKTMVVTLPVILLLLDWWPLRRWPFAAQALERSRAWPLLVEKIPFFALAFGCGLLTMHAERKVGAMEAVSSIPLSYRMANATFGFGRYLTQMVWPEGMAPFYPYPREFQILAVAGSGLLIVAMTVLALWMARGYPYVAFGWCWYVVILLPVCGLIQVGAHSRADRYTYIPLIGIFVLVTWGACDLSRRWPDRMAGLWGGAMGVLLLCAFQTRRQIGYWKDSEALFRHALAVTRENHFGHNNLGLALLQREQVDEAIAEFREAIKIEPRYSKPHNNLGIALLEQGRTDDAIREFRAALEEKGDFAEVTYNLGVAELRKGQFAEAIAQFQRALNLRPDLAKARYGLGSGLLRAGRTSEAIVEFQKVVALDPGYAEAHHDLGLAFLRSGDLDGAIAQFEVALRIHPDSYETRYNLGMALVRKNRSQEAIPELQRAAALQPTFLEARQELGRVYLRTGKIEEAMMQFESVAHANPTFPGAQSDLADALLRRGKVKEALAHYEAASGAEPANPVLLNNVAWILATSPDSTLRNGKRALELAQKAEKLSSAPSSSILGTLAAACAEAGKYPEAVSNAQRAVELAIARNRGAEVAALRMQIELYRAGSPYRDADQTSTGSKPDQRNADAP